LVGSGQQGQRQETRVHTAFISTAFSAGFDEIEIEIQAVISKKEVVNQDSLQGTASSHRITHSPDGR